jgi:hypothetical protein
VPLPSVTLNEISLAHEPGTKLVIVMSSPSSAPKSIEASVPVATVPP